MKKIVVFLFSLIFIFTITACEDNTQPSNNSEALQKNNSYSIEKNLKETTISTLTLEKVKELSEKGDALTWDYFEKYECAGDIGSGLYIVTYSHHL